MDEGKVNAESAQTVNFFELRLRQLHVAANVDPKRPSPEELILDAEIWIDGQLLDEPHSVAVNAVLHSFAKQGQRGWSSHWQQVFTCGCGSAACANIDEGIGTVHGDDTVDWVFRRPQANKFGDDPLGFKQWCETAQWHILHFDRHQVTRELIRFLDEVWMVLNTSEVEVSDRSSILIWFHSDPRYHMRGRSDESLSDQDITVPRLRATR